MPLYEIEHHVPLRDNQKDALAKQITNIHSRLFTTPSLFVNLRFLDKSASGDFCYVGGKRRNLNRIIAHIRAGGGRTTDDYNQLCDLVTEAWNRCVNDGNTAKRPTELHGIFVMGSIVAGAEAGFSLPLAGEDKTWLAANHRKFLERAKYGDQDFKDLLVEMKQRPDLRLDDYGEEAGDEIPPTYDSATNPSSPTAAASPTAGGSGGGGGLVRTMMSNGAGSRSGSGGNSIGSPSIGHFNFERPGDYQQGMR